MANSVPGDRAPQPLPRARETTRNTNPDQGDGEGDGGLSRREAATPAGGAADPQQSPGIEAAANSAQALEVPEFYGDPAAREFMSGIAAPLLAAASVTIIGVVVQQPNALRWPGIALLLLVIAAFLLVSAVQFGFLARRHVARPDEIAAWWPGLDEQARARRVRRDLKDDAALFDWWAHYAGVAYGLGVIVLWAAVGVAVAPSHGDAQADWRWVASASAWTGALFEAVWYSASRRKPEWFTPRRRARHRYKAQ